MSERASGETLPSSRRFYLYLRRRAIPSPLSRRWSRKRAREQSIEKRPAYFWVNVVNKFVGLAARVVGVLGVLFLLQYFADVRPRVVWQGGLGNEVLL